jgi:hypothetical protein
VRVDAVVDGGKRRLDLAVDRKTPVVEGNPFRIRHMRRDNPDRRFGRKFVSECAYTDPREQRGPETCIGDRGQFDLDPEHVGEDLTPESAPGAPAGQPRFVEAEAAGAQHLEAIA